MIFCVVDELVNYAPVGVMREIVAFIKNTDCVKLPVGDIPLRGIDLFARVGEYKTAPAATKRFETHQVYADVQYIVSGVEVMGFTTEAVLSALTAYDAKNDIQFFAPPQQVSAIVVGAGACAVFFPGEAHQPGCSCAQPTDIKKIVFKVRLAGGC